MKGDMMKYEMMKYYMKGDMMKYEMKGDMMKYEIGRKVHKGNMKGTREIQNYKKTLRLLRRDKYRNCLCGGLFCLYGY
jgi:hypothetical protein